MAVPNGRIRSRRWVAVSGIVTVALLAGIAVTRSIPTSPAADFPSRRYSTAVGEQASIQLPDGSRVQLAPKSQLTVSRDFGATSRTVQLTGEAYFDVQSMEGAPFIVQTGAVSTRVLGTVFDVRAYPQDRHVRVAVVSGKVASGGRESVTLTAGRVGLVTDSTAESMAGDVNTTPTWAQGRLVFDDIPVSEVLATVGLWYGYEFRLADSALAKERISVVIKVSAPTETMETLKRLLDVTMNFDRTVVTLRPRRKSAGMRIPPRLERDSTQLLYTRADQ